MGRIHSLQNIGSQDYLPSYYSSYLGAGEEID